MISTVIWRGLWARPLQPIITILLVALGIGLIRFVHDLQSQMSQRLDANLNHTDMVIGAKGSPLQLVLSSLFQIDVPTGNIDIKDVQAFLNPAHPLIKQAIPLATGDSYKGYRIIGTTDAMDDFYQLNGALKGLRDYEVAVGSEVAKNLQLQLGDPIISAHGITNDATIEHSDSPPLIVRKILSESSTILNESIICPVSTVWQIHGSHDHSEATETSPEDDHHDHSDHDHDHSMHDSHETMDDHSTTTEDQATVFDNETLRNHTEEAITAILVKFKGQNFRTLNFPRNINENTPVMAANPSYELSKLFSLTGNVTRLLELLGYIILGISFLTVFFLLWNNLEDRLPALALYRVKGGSAQGGFVWLLSEGLILAVLGAIIGIILGYVGSYLASDVFSKQFHFDFKPSLWNSFTAQLLLLSIAIGILGSIIPAIRAMRMNVPKALHR